MTNLLLMVLDCMTLIAEAGRGIGQSCGVLPQAIALSTCMIAHGTLHAEGMCSAGQAPGLAVSALTCAKSFFRLESSFQWVTPCSFWY